ncbi:ribosomal RNA small subunit methyltransferase A [Candidatus Uhrbacteria bacterium]|jgi:16S rRNA (adenine1518-N6/adenine1519-N6)-dimethyltransferase|nr:ribosomal RNA small subunit methyltransferase A [Candidatus Uhrbacteria bacterium]
MQGAKKSFGQHFLKDESLVAKIVAAAEIGNSDTVVEVGPGRGALTVQLPQDGLVLVEADKDLIDDLHERFPKANVVLADATQVDFKEHVGDGPWTLIGNLPYNAANAIIMNALNTTVRPTRVVVMVQKEVGDRMMAKPGTDMSVLSVAIQLYGTPTRVMNVKPGSFQPPPNVMSSVIRIDVDPRVEDPERVIALASAGFGSRRKQLHKNINAAKIASSKDVKEALSKLNLREDIRAQDMSVDDWVELSNFVL